MPEPLLSMSTEDAARWRFIVDDRDPVELRFGEITPAQAGALRQQSHGAWKVPTLLGSLGDGVGPEELNGLLFLAYRQAGADLSYDEVGQVVAEATRVDIVDASAESEDEDESPEA